MNSRNHRALHGAVPRTFAFAALALTLALAPTWEPVAAQESMRTLELETYLDWEWVSEPQISPDGSQIVYTRSWVDKINDRRQSSLWIMNADGSKNRFLVDGASPRWSPDGTRIAFTDRAAPESSQIFVRWMDAEGATTQITHLEHGPSNIEWSPDGSSISFTMTVESDPIWEIDELLPDPPDGAEWTDEPKVVDRLNFRRDRIGYTDDGYTHLFLVPSDGGTPRQLTDGDWNHRSPAWSPDGSEIYFTSLRIEDAEYEWRESEIYAVDVNTLAIRQVTTRHGVDGDPVPSPDGSLVAYQGSDWSDDTYVETGLYVMNRDGSNPRRIADELGRGLGNVTWAPDGSGVYFNTAMRGNANVWFAPVEGEPRPVTEGNHMLNFTSMGRDGRTLVGTRSSYHEPGDVVMLQVRSPNDVTELTHVNDDVLAGITLGEVEEVWYKSVDDYDIQGWIIKPPDFDPNRRYPMMLVIHGGPHGMYNVGFNFSWQDHAANGYVVLYTNPRGSSGYGSPFGNAIKNAYPGKDFDDLMGHDGWGQLVQELRAPAVGRPVRAPASFSPHVRGERDDAHDAHDGGTRSAHADAADRGVLHGPEVPEGALLDGALPERVARHQPDPVELPQNAAVPAGVVPEVVARPPGGRGPVANRMASVSASTTGVDWPRR
jgi:dipeptidyl aminopeptidase/acylaminoacyl peptidase